MKKLVFVQLKLFNSEFYHEGKPYTNLWPTPLLCGFKTSYPNPFECANINYIRLL